MNIWYDDQIFTIQKYGGISRYFVELIDGLNAMQGQRVHVDAPLHINAHLAASSFVSGRRIAPFRGVTRFCQRANRFGMARRIRHFSPEIIHETYFRNDSDTSCLPRVLTVYDMIHELFADGGRDDALGQAKRAAAMRADHIICISEHTRRDLIDIAGVDEKKTSVVYLAGSMQPDETTALPVDGPYLLYVGPRGRHKNFDCLLRSYAASSRLQGDFVLVCFGGGDLSSGERAHIRSLGIDADRVHHMSGGDCLLAALYSRANVFVYPSLYEGFGIPPLEAMQCGCPVVCTDRSSLPEVVGDAACLFNPDSSEMLLAALERLLYDSEVREDLIARGRERAAEFSWERCVDRTLDVYRRLAVSD